jgi:hypothetical protein
MGEQKPARMPRFPTLLEEVEKRLNKRVQRGEIKTVTKDTYLNDANRVLEALVFATEERDIQKAMTAYRYQGNYRKVIGDLKQIAQQRWTELKS